MRYTHLCDYTGRLLLVLAKQCVVNSLSELDSSSRDNGNPHQATCDSVSLDNGKTVLATNML